MHVEGTRCGCMWRVHVAGRSHALHARAACSPAISGASTCHAALVPAICRRTKHMLALCVHVCVCAHVCLYACMGACVQMMDQCGPGGTQERQREEAELEELTHGVRSYFDKCLSALLLYRSERVQAVAALSDGRSPAAVYGAEHLLRLMLKLPEIMPTAGMTQPQVGALSAKLQVGAVWYWCRARP